MNFYDAFSAIKMRPIWRLESFLRSTLHMKDEGFAVLLEEVDELWEEVRGHDSPERTERMRHEAIQVGAMAVRFLTDLKESK